MRAPGGIALSFPGGDLRHEPFAVADAPGDIDALRQVGVTMDADGRHQEITMLASVPLTKEPWSPLAEGEIIVVKDGGESYAAPNQSFFDAAAVTKDVTNFLC
jgi:hypothetical protein